GPVGDFPGVLLHVRLQAVLVGLDDGPDLGRQFRVVRLRDGAVPPQPLAVVVLEGLGAEDLGHGPRGAAGLPEDPFEPVLAPGVGGVTVEVLLRAGPRPGRSPCRRRRPPRSWRKYEGRRTRRGKWSPPRISCRQRSRPTARGTARTGRVDESATDKTWEFSA